jgi:hypothetical protein
LPGGQPPVIAYGTRDNRESLWCRFVFIAKRGDVTGSLVFPEQAAIGFVVSLPDIDYVPDWRPGYFLENGSLLQAGAVEFFMKRPLDRYETNDIKAKEEPGGPVPLSCLRETIAADYRA